MIRVMHICNQLGAYRISSGIYVGRCMDVTVARWPLVMPSNVMNVRGNTSDLQVQSASAIRLRSAGLDSAAPKVISHLGWSEVIQKRYHLPDW